MEKQILTKIIFSSAQNIKPSGKQNNIIEHAKYSFYTTCTCTCIITLDFVAFAGDTAVSVDLYEQLLMITNIILNTDTTSMNTHVQYI